MTAIFFRPYLIFVIPLSKPFHDAYSYSFSKPLITIFTGLKQLSLISFLYLSMVGAAQQYPFWTQYRSNLFMMNPAVAGTRQDIDARISYRNQWTGFDGAPVTMGASLHVRLYKKMMGLGAYVFEDKVGPFTTTTSALAYSFKIKFDDVALSLGANGSYNMQRANTGLMTYQNSVDAAVANTAATQKSNIFNGAAGMLLYNDRFYISLSMNQLAGTTFSYHEKAVHQVGEMKTVPHYCFSVGYNYAANPDYVWENSMMAVFVANAPILLDYYLRLHIKKGLIVGGGIRFGTAIMGLIGWTIQDQFQVTYSYDYSINGLRGTNGGSHEVKLVYTRSKAKLDHHKSGKEFQKQKFQYLI